MEMGCGREPSPGRDWQGCICTRIQRQDWEDDDSREGAGQLRCAFSCHIVPGLHPFVILLNGINVQLVQSQQSAELIMIPGPMMIPAGRDSDAVYLASPKHSADARVGLRPHDGGALPPTSVHSRRQSKAHGGPLRVTALVWNCRSPPMAPSCPAALC